MNWINLIIFGGVAQGDTNVSKVKEPLKSSTRGCLFFYRWEKKKNGLSWPSQAFALSSWSEKSQLPEGNRERKPLDLKSRGHFDSGGDREHCTWSLVEPGFVIKKKKKKATNSLQNIHSVTSPPLNEIMKYVENRKARTLTKEKHVKFESRKLRSRMYLPLHLKAYLYGQRLLEISWPDAHLWKGNWIFFLMMLPSILWMSYYKAYIE